MESRKMVLINRLQGSSGDADIENSLYLFELGVFPGRGQVVELQNHGNSFSVFWGPSILFFVVAPPVYVPTLSIYCLQFFKKKHFIVTSVSGKYVSGFLAKSCPPLATPWPVARQALLSMGFPRQEYRSGLPFTSPGDLPDPGMELRSPALQADSLLTEAPGSPYL